MKIVTIAIRTTAPEVKRGNIVEFAAACCDLEDTKTRWAVFEALIKNTSIIGTPAHLSSVSDQLAEIGGERTTWMPRLTATQVPTKFMTWLGENQCLTDGKVTVAGDNFAGSTNLWLTEHLPGWRIHIPLARPLDLGSLCYVEGSPVPSADQASESLGIATEVRRGRASDECLNLLSIVNQFFRG
ncbi:MAG: hypothetical protein GY906_04795 [bacterium]|nr:hypothetical protein [bacterium]